MNFWKDLKKPFFILAPMDDVTDVVFREIVAETAPPDVFFTEFTNVEGICSAGFKVVGDRLRFTEKQRPIVAQIWGLKPENFFQSAQIIADMGFDGIDINMGCPVRDVIKMGACSAMIDNPAYAKEVIDATIKGAKGLPVSVKTRLGTKEIMTEEWIGFLLKQNLAAITVHGRIAKEMSRKPANWEEIGKAVELRDKMYELRMEDAPVIIGNGDVLSRAQGEEYAEKYGVDGIMIGRGIFEDIEMFKHCHSQREENEFTRSHSRVGGNLLNGRSPVPAGDDKSIGMTKEERIELLLRHAKLYEETWKGKKHFLPMRKFVKVYIRDFDGSSELRARLMETQNLAEMERVLSEFAIN